MLPSPHPSASSPPSYRRRSLVFLLLPPRFRVTRWRSRHPLSSVNSGDLAGLLRQFAHDSVRPSRRPRRRRLSGASCRHRRPCPLPPRLHGRLAALLATHRHSASVARLPSLWSARRRLLSHRWPHQPQHNMRSQWSMCRLTHRHPSNLLVRLPWLFTGPTLTVLVIALTAWMTDLNRSSPRVLHRWPRLGRPHPRLSTPAAPPPPNHACPTPPLQVSLLSRTPPVPGRSVA